MRKSVRGRSYGIRMRSLMFTNHKQFSRHFTTPKLCWSLRKKWIFYCFFNLLSELYTSDAVEFNFYSRCHLQTTVSKQCSFSSEVAHMKYIQLLLLTSLSVVGTMPNLSFVKINQKKIKLSVLHLHQTFKPCRIPWLLDSYSSATVSVGRES